MNKILKSELKLIIDLITEPDYDTIDRGIDLLVKSGKVEFFEKILSGCRIIDGYLIASHRFTVTAPKQPFIDYALWNIIGKKPKNARVHTSLSTASIKQVTMAQYKSYLYHCHRMEKFPLGITYLNNIEKLDFSSARLEHIPNEINRLTKLKTINAKFNKIKIFPTGLCTIESLKCVDFSFNNIQFIPGDIFKLKNLEYLRLESNEITSLPVEIKELKNLECLRLESNKITSLPVEIKELKKLRILSISNNTISEIPLSICELENLEEISLRNIGIKFTPEELNNLKKLNKLDLAANNLNSIPNLNSNTIKFLDLSENKIKILSDHVRNMSGLQSLHLNENRGLQLIEPGIATLSNLISLELGKTGILSPRPHVLYLKGRENIDKYFNRILYHYKLRPRFQKRKDTSNTAADKSKHESNFNFRDVSKKPSKNIEAVISNLSNYLNSEELDIIDVGINLTTNIANEAVYNYLFGKWDMKAGSLSYNYLYNGFDFGYYRFRDYKILKLLISKNRGLKIHRNISAENIKCLNYDFFKARYPDFIFTLFNLTKVSFNLNNLELKEEIYQLTKLEEIELATTSNIDALNFNKFPCLKILEIKEVDSCTHLNFENLIKLNKLSVSKVNAQTLKITNNDNLEEISLNNLKIEKVDPGTHLNFDSLVKLNKLSVTNVNAQSLKITNNHTLEEISLNYLRNEKVDSGFHLNFDNLTKLKKLSVSSVDAQSLKITNNDALEEISLDNLKIENIEILNCRSLRKLSIERCEFLRGIEFSNFPNLKELNIKRTHIIGLMSFIINCPGLEKISVQETDNFKLDPSIENLKNIKSMNLSSNSIDHIPEEIGEMEKLENLIIKSNNIRNLPISLAKCKNLEILDIGYQFGGTKSENKLKRVPIELFHLKKMKSIQVSWSGLELRKFESKLSASDLYDKRSIISNY